MVGMSRDVPMRVAVIGAGIAGIAAGVNLKKAGIEDFTIFDKADGIGGTWFFNSYPGAACDVDSTLYSYSFHLKKRWSRRYATQPEILQYLNDVVDRFVLRSKLALGTGVQSCRYDESQNIWILTTEQGSEHQFDAVISCLGMLNDPLIPNIPGLETFPGIVTHTARWPKDLAVKSQRIALVGTGSSAAQIVPAIVPEVESLHLFQRQPGWVLPKPDKDHGSQLAGTGGIATKLSRLWQYLRREMAHGKYDMGSRRNVHQKMLAIDFIANSIHDPALREAVTPSYPFGCKRAVRDSNFYASLSEDNVVVVPEALARVDGSVVIGSGGQRAEVDIIVLATGFRAQDFLGTMEIVGLGGQTLAETWEVAGGPEAFLGVSVPDFPNFFIAYGPNSNTATTSMVFVLERQIEHIVRCLAYVRRRGLRGIAVKRETHYRFNRWLQGSINDTVWTAGCNNYFRSASGKVVTNWPHTSIAYAALLRVMHPLMPGVYQKVVAGDRSARQPVHEQD